MKRPCSCLIMVLIISFTLIAGNAWAIGLSPGYHVYDYMPGKEISGYFNVINSKDTEEVLDVSFREDFPNSLSLDIPEKITIAPRSSSRVDYRISMPQSISEPGKYITAIQFSSQPIGGGSVSVRTAMIYAAVVNVPYPGKYAEADFRIEEGEKIKFAIELVNLGSQTIDFAEATVKIFSVDDKEIASLITNSEKINQNERKNLTVFWENPPPSGKYRALAEVNYDGSVQRLVKRFALGRPLIEVLDITVKDFRLGDVAKFDVVLENKWNEKIEEVYAEMQMENGSTILAAIKSPSVDLEPLDVSTLNVYWDTQGVEVGTYNSTLKLYYGGEMLEKRFSVFLKTDSILTDFTGIGLGAITLKEGSATEMVVIIFAPAIVIIALLIVYYKKSRAST